MSPGARRPYAIVGRAPLGEGGYAQVFKARKRDAPNEIVALKKALNSTDAIRRLSREIDALRQLDHPNVMPLIDAAVDNRWYVMPLADGNLEDLWAAGDLGRDAEVVALAVVDAISSGLEAAHARDLVHRDVSPRNILRLTDDAGTRWVVADWGAVRRPRGQTTRELTTTHQGLGTRGFAAPEAWEHAREADPRADVYSVGRIVAWLVSGRWPQQNVELVVEGRLGGFVVECTAHDVSRRPVDMAALRVRLDELLREPDATPLDHAHALVERLIAGGSGLGHLLTLALARPNDDELYLDELARVPPADVRELAESDPATASRLALTMLELLNSSFGHRDFGQLDDPLRFAFEITVGLTDSDPGRAEALAVAYFEAEARWDQWRQLRRTTAWLAGVHEGIGQSMARALRRAGVQDYYQRALGESRIASRALRREIGR